MEAHHEPPPDGLWDGIMQTMDRRTDARLSRRRVVFRRAGVAVAAAVAVFLFVVVGDRTVDMEEGPNRPTANSEQAPRRADVLARDDGPRTGNIAVVEVSDISRFPKERPSATGDITAVEVPDNSRPPEEQPSTAPELSASHMGDDKAVEVPDSFQSPGKRPSAAAAVADPYIPPKNKKSRWQADIYASNISSSRSGNAAPANIMFAGSATHDMTSSERLSNGFAASSADYTVFSHNMTRGPIYSDVRHRQPVELGVSVSYALGERWSLTGGATYSLLTSRFRTTGGRSSNLSGEQRLHNIGIPLGVNYSIWRGAGVSVYVSAGGQVEKSVSGSVKYTRESGEGWSEKISDRVQWSVEGAAGVQYDFARSVGLFVEPGINYHFDNGSAIETIYKQKPFNFGLRLGLRFSL